MSTLCGLYLVAILVVIVCVNSSLCQRIIEEEALQKCFKNLHCEEALDSLVNNLDISNKLKLPKELDNLIKSLHDKKRGVIDEKWKNRNRFHKSFQTFKSIESKLNDMAKRSGGHIKVETITNTFEGNPVYLVKVSYHRIATTYKKPVIFIDAGHHAREWITHSTAMYLLDGLFRYDMPRGGLKYKTNDHRLSSLLPFFDFWIMPVVNPDGYLYTHQDPYNHEMRYWRKNRSVGKINSTDCIGVDLNRNYNFAFESGINMTCTEAYPGLKALSEVESLSLSRVLTENQDRIKMYISLHSYGSKIIIPYGYTDKRTENHDKLMAIAQLGTNAIKDIEGPSYERGISQDMIGYKVNGSSMDYAYEVAKIKLAFTFELAGKDFVVSPKEIIAVGYQTDIALTAMIKGSL